MSTLPRVFRKSGTIFINIANKCVTPHEFKGFPENVKKNIHSQNIHGRFARWTLLFEKKSLKLYKHYNSFYGRREQQFRRLLFLYIQGEELSVSLHMSSHYINYFARLNEKNIFRIRAKKNLYYDHHEHPRSEKRRSKRSNKKSLTFD